MRRRTVGAVIATLLVVGVGAVSAIVYPVTTIQPNGTRAPAEQLSVGNATAYHASGRIVTDGESTISFEGTVTADGAWYQRVTAEGITTETYHPASTNMVVRRRTLRQGPRAKQLRESIADDADRTLLTESQTGDTVTVVTRTNSSDTPEPVTGTSRVIVRSLAIARFDPSVGEQPGTEVRHPRSGWYAGSESYRLTDAAGTIRIDPNTNAVTGANVSWELTSPASSLWEYELVRMTTDDPTTQRITYQYDTGGQQIDTPGWTPDL